MPPTKANGKRSVMIKLHNVVLTAVLVASSATAAAAQEETTEAARSFPHAGIAWSLPSRFEYRRPSGAYTVAEAVLKKGGERPVVSVTLSAYPAAETATLEGLCEAAEQELRADLAVRDLEVLKKTPMEVAGQEGLANRLRYRYRGEPSVAAQVFFLRSLERRQGRITYVLTVEAPELAKERLLPTLSQVVKSISLVTVRRPVAIGVGRLGEPIVDRERGYSIRPPEGWYAQVDAMGASMGQVDYLLGGQPNPTVRLVAATAPPDMDADACAGRYIRRQVDQTGSGNEGPGARLVGRKSIEMGGLEGCQFILERPAPQATTNPQSNPAEVSPVLELHRAVCPAAQSGQQRTVYALILVCRDLDAKGAEAMADRIAEGFSLLKAERPGTAAASEPTSAAVSQPTN